MKLWTFELRKILITRKVLLVFLAALVLRTVFLSFFPELKDERIRLTQKQYNAFLMKLQGENNTDKEQFVRSSYEKCREVTECFAEMQDMHENRLITEEVWQKYTLEYEEAMLSRNALSIFYEKEEAGDGAFCGAVAFVAAAFPDSGRHCGKPLRLRRSALRKPHAPYGRYCRLQYSAAASDHSAVYIGGHSDSRFWYADRKDTDKTKLVFTFFLFPDDADDGG